MRSRWDTSARLDEKGKPIPVVFGADDLEICRLFAPVQGVRQPFSYQYLPTGYVPLLLGRGKEYMINRLQQLVCEPHCYLAQPDQPRNNFRDIIFSIGANGIDELREVGHDVPRKALRRLPHELFNCIGAASFEYGSTQHKGVKIELVKERHDFYPDLPIFWLSTPHQEKKIYFEGDCGTEQLEAHPSNTTIDDKFEQYLCLGSELKDSMVVFVTVRGTRVEKMIDRLKRIIDKRGMPHGYARSFAFTHIAYDRFLTKVPKLTDWALTADYQRAGSAGPFNFMRAGK